MRSIKTLTNFFYVSIAVISILILSNSCVKQTTTPDPTKPTPPVNPTGSNIIYTNVDPDSSILLLTDSFNLDLNNDGITDFEFKKSLSSSECGHNPEVPPTVAFHINLSVTSASAVNAIMTNASTFLALALDSSAAIGPDSLWSNASQALLEGGAISYCALTTTGHAGYWLNIADKYIGLKFIKGNDTYYGWARLSSTYSLKSGSDLIIGGQLILKDYAYNSVSNQPILAGQTK